MSVRAGGLQRPVPPIRIQTFRTQSIVMPKRKVRLDGSAADPGYEEEILRSLRRIIRAVDLYSHRLMAGHGLSGPQLICLTQLAKADMLSGALARELSLSPATVTGILDRLEGRGLVERRRQMNDKRTVVVRLTPSGKRLLAQAPPPLQQSFLSQLRALPETEQAAISEMLRRLVTMMSADEIDAAPMLATGEAMAGRETSAALMDEI